MKRKVWLIPFITGAMLLSGCHLNSSNSTNNSTDTPTTTTNQPGDVEETGFVVTDSKNFTYLESDVFDSNNGLTVTVNYSDNSSKTLAKNEYSYKVLNSSNTAINSASAFNAAGTFKLIVNYKTFEAQTFSLTVNEEVVLKSITVSMTTTSFSTEDTLSAHLSGNLVANKIYNHTNYNESNVAYSAFSTKKLSVSLFNPSNVSTSINSKFTTEGTWKVRVSSTENTSIYGDVSITVKAPVSPINVDASITVNKTFTNNRSCSPTKTDFLTDGITLTGITSSSVFGTGENSLRLSSTNNGGTLQFAFNSLLITGVVLNVKAYNSSVPSIKVSTSANTAGQTLQLTSEQLMFDVFANDTAESKTLTISAAKGNRFYISSIGLMARVPDPIYPTSISLSGNSEIGLNKSTSLTVSYTPINTNKKTVTWESDNESIAKVNNGTVTGVATGTTVIRAKALKENGEYAIASHTVTVIENPLASWTIMIYMCGADLESAHGLATSDLNEIKSVSGQGSDINVIVEAGGASSWKGNTNVISKSYLNRFHLDNKAYVKDEQITKANMGLSSTFQSFLEWGLTEYPAQKTGVILWNHGGGQFGVCYDENYNDDSLNDNEVLTAVGNTFTKLGRTEKLEWIGYDACLMQLQEIAEFNSKYFNYMIGSQESEAGEGWDYDTWIDDLFANKSTETILKAIVDGFITDNGGVNATSSYYSSADQTLSYLNLAYAPAYKSAWESMAEALKGKINSSNAATFRRNVIGKVKYFADTDYDYFSEFDTYHFLTILESNSTFNPGSSYINAVKTAFNNFVVYSVSQQANAKDAHGLSMFFPASSDTSYGQKSYCTSAYSSFTNWNYICTNYGGSVNSSY